MNSKLLTILSLVLATLLSISIAYPSEVGKRTSDASTIKEITQNYFVTDDPNVVVEIGNVDDNGCISFYANIIDITEIDGLLCPNELSLKVCVTILGYNVGCIDGDLQGVRLSINLLLVKGSVAFYMDGTCPSLAYDLIPTWDESEYGGELETLCY
ncbi:13503_t:CDS:2 [Acaulospora colombiana]|uniref:13503_t:CDS:1 n=1 Tax=Acaulospora colombiana TaxID=27376 RepID=A0ACA9L256_9GLOM|nr:13503_t:CDS:2 [Acaulospora colombiana]